MASASKYLQSSSALHIVDGFYPEAKKLRAHFDARFKDPRKADGNRFVWDYWHVPGQYTALRTPAWEYFPSTMYKKWHASIVRYGREVLGCHDISPPWLSCYVDGGRQELHADQPHGPWAFVFSLTPPKRAFRGGETLIVKEDILSFWSRAQSGGLEEADVFSEVTPEFNRLTIFDPRLPHGVRRVEGTHDPREGRLVMHGWFVQPRPFVEGGLSAARLAEGLEPLHRWLGAELRNSGALGGMQSYRLVIAPSGRVNSAKLLVNRTLALEGSPIGKPQVALAKKITAQLSRLRFAPAKLGSRATLPLVFEG